MTKRPAPAPSTADWASHGRSATCTHAGHVFCRAIYAKGIICARGDAARGGSRRSTPPPRRTSPRRVRCTSMYARSPSTAPHWPWRLMSTRPYHYGRVFSLRLCSLGSDAATWYALMPLAWCALMPLAVALGSSRRRRCLLALKCLGRHGLLQRQPGKLGNVGVRARALASRVAL